MLDSGDSGRWVTRLGGWGSAVVLFVVGALPVAPAMATEPRPELTGRVREAMERIHTYPTARVMGGLLHVRPAIRGIVERARSYQRPSHAAGFDGVEQWVASDAQLRAKGLTAEHAKGALGVNAVGEAYAARHEAPQLVRPAIRKALAAAIDDPFHAMEVGHGIGVNPEALHPALACLAGLYGTVEVTRDTVEEALGRSLSITMAAHTTARRMAWNEVADLARSDPFRFDLKGLAESFHLEQRRRAYEQLARGLSDDTQLRMADLNTVLPAALFALHRLGESARIWRNDHWVEKPGWEADAEWSYQAIRLANAVHEKSLALEYPRAASIRAAAEELERFYPRAGGTEPEMAAQIRDEGANQMHATELLGLVPVRGLDIDVRTTRWAVDDLLGAAQLAFSEPERAEFTPVEIAEAVWALLAEEPHVQ